MDEQQSTSDSCFWFPTLHVYSMIVTSIFGIITNSASVAYLKKNFQLNKAIYQILISDALLNIIGTVVLVVEFS